jgi:hypothetical protein
MMPGWRETEPFEGKKIPAHMTRANMKFQGEKKSTIHIQFRVDLQNLGVLVPVVWEEIENEQTVVNLKIKK